jgi:hypothetical protein
MHLKVHRFAAIVMACVLLFSVAKAQTRWGQYTLIAPNNNSTAKLIDLNNNTYHSWTLSGATTYSAYMINGDTLFRSVTKSGNSFSGGPISGQVQMVDWNGNVVWNYVYSTTQYCSHHDIHYMPNGNVLLIAYELKTATDATAAGCSQAITMWPDKIVEVQPTGPTTGNVVWEWHSWDHLMQNVDATKANYVSNLSDHPELMNINYKTTKDWLHMNGIDYNPTFDQITFSSHNMNEVYVIDHSTTTAEAASHSGGNSGRGGDILYRWGNPAAYGVTTPAANFNVVHDAHWAPVDTKWAYHLVGFNNYGNATVSYVDVFLPPMNGAGYVAPTPGTAYGPATYANRVTTNGHTNNAGNSEQFPNGNMLICVAIPGYIYEIDSLGNTVWSYQNTGSLQQAHRYTACNILGTQPATPSITSNGTVLNTSGGSTYQWYFNGAAISGATAASYTATQNGSYQVQITDASGCNSELSAAVNVMDANTGIAHLMQDMPSIVPNPSSGLFELVDRKGRLYDIEVMDLQGRVVKSIRQHNHVDLSEATNGVYMLRATLVDGTYFTARIVKN